MSQIGQIRNVPDDVHRVLTQRSADAGLSLSEYLRRKLTRDARLAPIGEVIEWVRSERSGASLEDAITAVRADRDSR